MLVTFTFTLIFILTFKMDCVVLGAEGVCESGGIINQLGTLTLAIVAQQVILLCVCVCVCVCDWWNYQPAWNFNPCHCCWAGNIVVSVYVCVCESGGIINQLRALTLAIVFKQVILLVFLYMLGCVCEWVRGGLINDQSVRNTLAIVDQHGLQTFKIMVSKIK